MEPKQPDQDRPVAAGQPAGSVPDSHVASGNPHGKPSSWLLISVVITAFLAGGAAIITHLWWLLWTCVGVIVVAVPVGKAIGIMDDTVAWGSSPSSEDTGPLLAHPGRPGRERPGGPS
ncbi:MAG: hypothetical protein J2P35_18445 [Actinobacteria bacterium]|nr:hypothetical protein [Actinomycetota bacterium]